jgi:hypothetical protein
MTVSVYLSDMLKVEIILELNEHTRKDIYLIYTGLQVIVLVQWSPVHIS